MIDADTGSGRTFFFSLLFLFFSFSVKTSLTTPVQSLNARTFDMQVSVGGRDNFLAAESDKSIALMIDCCSETKVATALLAHVQHKNPQVRAKVASHLDSLVQGDHGFRLAGMGWALT